jgi:hypothetical protein
MTRDRLDQCHKCRKTIRGPMIYSGGWVWHPKCYPNQAALKKAKRKK